MRKIPKGCPDCNKRSLDLTDLVLKCMNCGWTRNLQYINDLIYQVNKRRK